MQNFGETVRSIRTNRGIKQNELYNGILSKSYAIQFEKGLHDVSFYLLIQVLNRFPMEVDEFLYIHRGYQGSETAWFYDSLAIIGNDIDLEPLKKFKKEYLTRYSNSEHHKGRLLQIDFRIEQLTYYSSTGKIIGDTIEPQVQEEIQNLLRKIQAWTIEDFRFFSNVIDLVDIFDMTQYFKLLLKDINQYKNFESAKGVICILLINAINKFIFSDKREEAKELLRALNEFTKGIDQMFYRNYYFFFDAVVNKLDGDESGVQKAKNAITIFKDLGYEHHADMAKAILTEILTM
ncbi:hypothetical protein KQI33_08930 [Enterococcus devriesei]|uniref:helix-turn-helix domain-containing protein n=1 Tax=Enterococcus devriesei TaxID=319970 RepID=UPI001C11659C|nr:Rgg/GadR/MutR family transcriptional regulator [Enterococcus devriesei]MBU5365495.1 hypothetical protein [Enterococcus devriesei]